MKIRKSLGIFAAAAALILCGGKLTAQDGGGPGGPGGPGNFDPAQFRQRMMEQVRSNLGVTNDEEWTVIEPLVQKVMDARRETFSMGMGMGPGGPPPGGGQGGPPRDGGGGNGGGRRGFGPQPSAEQQALRKVIDDKAPSSQIKDALGKYRASQTDKQARLVAAQASLKGVLTVKQEAEAVLMGLLQ